MVELQQIVADAIATGSFSWDLETESITDNPRDVLDPFYARPTEVAIATANYKGCWDATPEVLNALVGLLTNPNLWALVFNLKYDHAVLHHSEILKHKDLTAKPLDLFLLVCMVDEEDLHGLKHSVKKFLNIKMIEYADVTKNSAHAKKLSRIQDKHAQYSKMLSMWRAKTPKRPWPTWKDPLHSRTAISKKLREADPELKAAQAKELVADLFGEDYYEEFEDWLHEQMVGDTDTIAECKAEISKHMKVYAADDAGYLFDLLNAVMPILQDEATHHIIPVEMAVAMEVLDMHIYGMPIDRSVLEGIETQIDNVIEELEAEVYELAGQEFNIGSTPQLREIVFDVLGVEPPADRVFKRGTPQEQRIPAFTKKGIALLDELRKNRDPGLYDMDCRNLDSIPTELREYLAVGAVVLERLSHPIGQAVLNYRSVAKLKSTYIDGSYKALDKWNDGRIHGIFNSHNTKTFRFSSNSPNLQNIPSRAKSSAYPDNIRKLGPAIREAFVAPPPDEVSPEGYCLLVTDHSQIELRLIAHFSKDKNLNRVYNQHTVVGDTRFYTGDIHQMTSELVGCGRKEAKSSNFGLAYGMKPRKFALQNRVFVEGTYEYDVDKCLRLTKGWFKSYKGVDRILAECGQLLEDEGVRHFKTIAGRKRHFYNKDRNAQYVAPGMVLNSVIQGSSADILKYVIYIVRRYLYPLYPGLRLIGQVHDEVIFAVPNLFKEELGLLLKFVMEYPWYPLSVPILASAKLSHSWGAKDNDEIAEIGTFYAKIDGEERLFTEDNWDEFLAADEAGLVEEKAACGHLTPEQFEWCKTVIPIELPPKPKRRNTNVVSHDQLAATHRV